MHRIDFFAHMRRAPRWSEEILERFGRNPYGEPILRLAWLPSRCHLVGGFWDTTGEFAYKVTPKYGRKDRKWAIERWIPASSYGSPWNWEMTTVSREGFWQLGPYPAHGEFECCSVFTTGFGDAGFVPLEPGVVELQARLIWSGRIRTQWDIRNELLSAEQAKERLGDENFRRMWDDCQLRTKGLSFGAAGAMSYEEQIADYRRRMLRAGAIVTREDFTPGFKQGEDVN